MLIVDEGALFAFAQRCLESPYLAIDTEFLREKTYYAQLCLVQVAIEGEVAIIDPLEVEDLSPLAEALVAPQIVKIFHACHQDMEVLIRACGVVPTPVFDTQIAAALLGKSQQASYSSLVSQYCDVQLPKKDSFTDWSRRPLRDSQIRYAADDVIYLPKIYAKMVALLEERNRLSWLDEAFADLSNPLRYSDDMYGRYKKLRRVNQLNPRQQSAARELAAWREKTAQRRNRPRKWIMTDEQIVEACRREAKTLDELFMVRGMKDSLGTKAARDALQALIKGLDAPEEEWPKHDDTHVSEANVDVMVDLMMAIVHVRARQNDIATQTLAPQAELAKLARGHRNDCELLQGWRYHVVGKDLEDLIAGKISLSLDDGNLEILRS